MTDNIHNRQGIRDIPEICSNLGISFAIIAPGSRNAPLIIAFAKYSNLHCLSIADERSAAYIALGIAQFSQKPVALVCTSGTAVLNCAPAIAEAYYQELPLIVFTADRPKEWIDQSDGQTIRQNNIFANYCKAFYKLPADTYTTDDLWFTHRQVSQAIDFAMVEPKGPVQINVPLKEPLYIPLPEKSNKLKTFSSTKPTVTISDGSLEQYVSKWNSATKKLILFGVSHPDKQLKNIADKLMQREDVLIIAENIANISGKKIISTPESFIAALNADDQEQFKPDLFITIGHSVVSKKLKQYLRTNPPAEQWHIEEYPRYIDTFKNLSTIIQINPTLFLQEMAKLPVSQSNYSGFILNKYTELNNSLNNYLKNIKYSDFKVFSEILPKIPVGTVIHFSNSTPIRYSQLFESRNDISYYCNRGTSGIDGCSSTVIGSAIASGKPTLLITGDIAFIYDSNAFWNKYIPSNFKVIVINNNGGNIFRMIDTSEEINDIKPFFETPHSIDIKKLSEAYGLQYFNASDIQSLTMQLSAFFNTKEASILEITTDASINTSIFKGYFKHIKS